MVALEQFSLRDIYRKNLSRLNESLTCGHGAHSAGLVIVVGDLEFCKHFICFDLQFLCWTA